MTMSVKHVEKNTNLIKNFLQQQLNDVKNYGNFETIRSARIWWETNRKEIIDSCKIN